jgi:hypothetical protein
MRYRAFVPAFVLTAALTVTGCGTDDRTDTYDTLPPATETTTPGTVGTDPTMTTTPGAYDPAQPGMTTDTAWGADTVGATQPMPPRP